MLNAVHQGCGALGLSKFYFPLCLSLTAPECFSILIQCHLLYPVGPLIQPNGSLHAESMFLVSFINSPGLLVRLHRPSSKVSFRYTAYLSSGMRVPRAGCHTTYFAVFCHKVCSHASVITPARLQCT